MWRGAASAAALVDGEVGVSLRWRWLGYVDPALRLTPAERNAAQRRANEIGDRVRWLRTKVILATLLLPVAVIGGGMIAAVWLARTVHLHWSLAALGYVVACVLSVWLYARLVWSWYARPLRLALREMGHDVCVECGYWLRGLRGDVKQCPECGGTRN